jgi:hypothetical protein
LTNLLDDADREMYAAKADHPLNKEKPNLAKAAEQLRYLRNRRGELLGLAEMFAAQAWPFSCARGQGLVA